MREKVKQLDLVMRSYRWHVERLNISEEKLMILRRKRYEAKGVTAESIGAGKISVTTYHDDNIDQITEMEKWEQERNYHKYVVDDVSAKLQKLNEEEIEFIHNYYWHEYSINALCQMYYYSKSMIYNKRNDILEKMLDS